jgi:parallel beta-helix repeat protein
VGIMIVRAENARILGNTITANGQMGIGQYRSPAGRIENNRITANNTAEFWRADWESGGIKVTKSSSTIANNHIFDNLGVGVWIDEAGDDVSILSNDIQGNAACGVRYEISRNGRIIGNTIRENALALKRGAGTNIFTGAGITVNTSSDVTIENNKLLGNLNGIGVQARPRGEGPWGEYVLEKITVKGNHIDLRAPATATTGYVEADSLVTTPPASAVIFHGNRYVFTDPASARFNLKDRLVDFRAWQAAEKDKDGTVADR